MTVPRIHGLLILAAIVPSMPIGVAALGMQPTLQMDDCVRYAARPVDRSWSRKAAWGKPWKQPISARAKARGARGRT